MTSDPSKLMDSEGEEMSLNKVDKALQSVGITIQDTNHQFRAFDEVITELADKWSTIDTNTQRYIATVMAGNRQQSRFLALVSNGERLAELSEKAANAEDAATLQVLKTMDSIDAKTQQLKTSLQSLYVSSGVQNFFKGILDFGNEIVKTFTRMPTVLGQPIPAILKIGTTFASLANVVTNVFATIKTKLTAQESALTSKAQIEASKRVNINRQEASEKILLAEEEELAIAKLYQQDKINFETFEKEKTRIRAQEEESRTALALNGSATVSKNSTGYALGLNIAGVALSTIAGTISDKTRGGQIFKGLTGITGSMASMAGLGTSIGGLGLGTGIGAAIGAVMGLAENANFLLENAENRANRLKEAATEANNIYLQKKDEYTSYKEEIDQLKELEKARYDSKEANEEYLNTSNQIASQHPELIIAYDEEGNAVLDLASSYYTLEEARQASIEAGINAAQASIDLATEQRKQAEDRLKERPGEARQEYFTQDVDRSSIINRIEVLLSDILTKDIQLLDNEQLNTLDSVATRLGNGILNFEGAVNELNNVGLGLDLNRGNKLTSYLYSISQLNNGQDNLLKYVNTVYANQNGNEWLKTIIESAQDLNDYENTIELVNRNRDALNNFAEEANDAVFYDFIKALEGYTGSIISAQSDITKAVEQQRMGERSGIASTVRGFMYGSEADKNQNADFFKEFDSINELISNYVYDSFEAFKESAENKDKAFSQFTSSGAALDAYNEIYELVSNIWKNATDSQKEQFNTLLKNSGNYNRIQFGEELQKIIPEISEDLVNQLQEQYYNTAYSYSNYINALASRYANQDFNLFGAQRGEILETLGGDELQQILSVYDNIASQIKNKQITPEMGQNILNNYFDIWEVTNSFDSTSRELAQNLLSNWNDFSIAGLNEFVQKIQSVEGLSEEDKANLIKITEAFSNLVPKNLNIELQTFSQTITASMSDFEKALSNAAKGMDFKTASELAEKAGKSLNDFEFKDGKFFFSDFAAIRDAYLGDNKAYIDKLTSQVRQEQNKLADLSKILITDEIEQDNGVQLIEFSAEDLFEGTIDEVREKVTQYVDQLTENGYDINSLLTAYETFINDTQKTTNNFVEYASEQLGIELNNTVNIANKYTQDLIARSALGNGNITEFLNAVLGEITGSDYYSDKLRKEREKLKQQILSGNYDIETLPEELRAWATELQTSLKDVQKNVFDNAITSLTKGTQTIAVTEGNEELLKSLDFVTISEDSKTAFINAAKDDIETIRNGILNAGLLAEDTKSLLSSLHTEQFKNNAYDGLKDIVKSYDSFNYETGQKYAMAFGTTVEQLVDSKVFEFDSAGNLFVNDVEAMYDRLYADINHAFFEGLITEDEVLKLRADLEKQKGTLNTDNIIRNVITQRDKITTEGIMQLGKALNMTYGRVIKDLNLQENDDGTYTMSIATLWNNFKGQMNDTLKEYVAEQIDNVISSITGLAGSQSKGYTNLADMQKFVNNLNKMTGIEYDFKNLFEYSDTLHAYQLSAQGIIAQVRIMKSQLNTMTGEQREVAEKLIEDTTRQFAEQINISDYISSIGTVDQEKQWSILQKSITDYNDVLLGLAEMGTDVVLLNSETLKKALDEGGLKAVEVARTVAEAAGKTLTAEEVEAAYRSEASQLTDAFEQLVYEPGVIIDNTAAEILRQAGYGIQEIEGTGQSLITSVGKLNRAYRGYLRKLQQTGEATLVDLNEATAMVLETNKGEESDAISALSKAADMTYAEFAEIFTKAGIELTETMVTQLDNANIIKRIGGGKMQILNWNAFADLMGWTDLDSEEYVSAFKTYNDALIEMNRKAERNIVEEIQSIGDAKAGDVINLTQLTSKLNDETEAALKEKLANLGATLTDGLLILEEKANIPAIIQTIAQEAASNADLLQDSMAELADTLNDVLENYTNLISNGIEGKLTNTQALDLQVQAKGMGFTGDLDFTKTADGLKLSSQSAASLYSHLKNVDTIRSHLVLDKLYSSITTTDERLKSVSGTMNRISEIQKQIAKNERDINGLINVGADENKVKAIQKENEKLEEQLQLYKDIRLEQMNDPDSYAFMDRTLPEQFQGAENYYNSVGKAFKAINEAGESGYMEIADFYNFINEASELAELSGKSIDLWGMKIDGSAENAAALIEKGFSALSNVDGEGVKIDLERLGVNFKNGADGMANGFTDGIKAMAKSQIELIDAEIAMLETFVALQALDELDTDNDGLIELVDDELVTVDKVSGKITGFTKKYTGVMDKIKKSFTESNNKDIQNAWKNLRINGHDLNELFSASTEQLQQWGISLDEWEGMLNALNKLVHSDEFADKPGELIAGIEDLLSGEGISGLNISYDAPGVESITLVDTGNKFGIDFDSAASEAAKKFLDEHGLGGDNTSLTEAFKKYEAGTATPVELTATMMAKGIVKTTDDGIDIIKDDGSVQHFSSENDPGYIEEALHKAASVNALEELGVDGKIKYDGGTHEATSTYKIGKKTVNVSSKDGKINYHSDMTGQDYETPEALRDAEYAHELDRFYKGYRDNPGTKEEFEAIEYGFKLDIKANVQSDIINEPELREKAKKIANMPIEEVENIIKDQVDPTKSHKVNADGTIDVDVEGVQMTIQNKGSLTDKAEAIKGEVLGAIDPDGWITKISVAITDAFKTLNMAQLLIDGLTESLNVQQNNETGEISFTENPTITALGENLGKGMAAGIASAASTGIKTYFDTEGNQVAITEPLKTGVKNAAESTEVTDADYTIPSATATLTKMTIDQVDEVGFSAPSLGDLVKALVGGTKTSDLTLDSATAAVKKLSLVSVDETDLQTQLTAEVEAKIEPIDVSSITTANDAITQTITAVSASLNTLKESIGNLDTNSVSANTSATALNTTLTNISSSTGPARAEDFKNYLNDITPDGPNRAFSFKEAVNALASYGPSYAADFVRSVNALQPKTVQLHGHLSLDAHVNTDGAVSVSAQAGPINASFAKGNANTKNRNPKGSNKTLVGELGPELVVSNGRYYVVGQNGAEMIDLPNDAIIFNHIQTKKLLGSGKGGRGTPITTEKNAVSYATGNVSGPAMVSAQAAIASLKQLRAMWESMLNATAQQLGSQAGKSANKSSGKDSSGNNKSDTVTAEDGTRIKTTTAEIQRWYNLLRQIDKTEKDITYQEKLQTQYQSLRVADGKSLYKSYKAELAMLDDQVARSQELADLQKSWYDTKRAELAASAYGKIFRYTEDGLQQYVDGANKGLDILEKLTEADIWGNPTGYATSAETQLSYIQSLGFDLNDLLSNSDGTKVGSYIGGTNYIVDENGERLEGQDLINAQVSIMENFWDNIDGWRDELDGLYDSYREQLSNVLDNQNKQNEIMQKIVDNQIEVENKVYQALVDARQAIIDNAQKELDAYQKNSEDMIASLNKSLEKERQLYNNQQNSNELLKLQRQLAILQRSGGSTAQILNLQNQIATKQQDMYFDEKEQQIQALQEASDLQIEKMEEQIALMTETLEYEKENGLLWKQVYDVMQRSPEEIIGFIAENSADWASNSALQISQNIADLQTKIQVYVSSRDDNFLSYYNDISSNIHDIAEAVSTYRNEALNYNNEVSSSNAEPASRPVVTSVPTYTSSSSSSSGGNSNNSYKPTSYDIPNDYNGTATLNEGSTTTYKMGSKGYFKGTSKSIGHRGDEVTIIEENAGSLKDGRQVSLVEYKGKQYYIRNERLAYKNGGLIDFTGPAWVDGTPSQPEAILSAKETKFVQNNLPNFLSNIDTLQERLIDMQDLQASWLSSISRIIDANNAQTEGVNIEHVELIMNVEQMSNSADAKKLGKEVLDELLSLSRKSGRNSVSRR